MLLCTLRLIGTRRVRRYIHDVRNRGLPCCIWIIASRRIVESTVNIDCNQPPAERVALGISKYRHIGQFAYVCFRFLFFFLFCFSSFLRSWRLWRYCGRASVILQNVAACGVTDCVFFCNLQTLFVTRM